MSKKTCLRLSKKPISVRGSVIYSERYRSRSIIVLKKQIRDEFKDSCGKNRLVTYKMEYHRTHKELLERIKKIIESEEGLPFLTFFYKG